MIGWLMVAQERYKDLLREAEQARLIRAAKGPRKSKDQQLSVMFILSSLMGQGIRPQS